ncbi:hypothetical protein V8V91_20170 [Algoriphagus halophilus]|uniref:hypothetical protein n=1 Tax=Algoriphagus halophilus TaxID=226505 RepID=UPI00358F3C34
MVNIVLSILLSFLLQTPEEQAYFYFGNDNLIGVGNLVEGKNQENGKFIPKPTQFYPMILILTKRILMSSKIFQSGDACLCNQFYK